ncbi:hypothetical protein TNIN_43871 [Trichonephila inaurata madagascariensis]|uniref:Uncharacterized protein n=1 Tax=Trichonephila inaurata madagascariensis TaxID=2747483 RepID=A0A8X6WPG6_9ARAC|nr:hypothetical protein TNIN_43871 [Trichonephila inaurata madagascariensis]
MINDLLSFKDNAVPEINTLLYANDLVLWSTGSDIPKLKSTLNLPNWSLKNDFKAGVKWGSSQSVLTSTMTPIAAMQLQTDNSGPSERGQYSALSLGERLM